MAFSVKAWLDRFGSGGSYEAPSTDPADNTPLDSVDLRDMETRLSDYTDTREAAEVSARNTAINTHAVDTTAVHGIADTAALATSAALASGLAGKANAAHTHTVSSLGTGTPASGKYLDGGGAWTTLPASGPGGGSVSADEQAALDAAASPTASNEFMTASAVDAAVTAALAGFTSSGLPPNAGLVIAQEVEPDATSYPQLWVPTDSTRTLQVGPVAWVPPSGADTAPAFTVNPVITGSGVVGGTLTCNGGTVTGSPTPTKTYQWKRGGVNISAATASTYVVVSGDIGAALTCAVTATNTSGSASATSNTITGSASATVPGQPTGLTLTPGNTQIGAAWIAPASDGGSAITTYLVEWRQPAGSGSYATFVHSASTTPSITITGVANGTLAGVRVSAVNAIGTGTPTAEVTTTPAATGGAVIIEDVYTDTDGTPLSAHTVAPTGGPVTVFNSGSFTAVWTVKSNRVYSDANYALAHYDPAPATNECDIDFVIRCVSAAGFVAVVARATYASFIATHYEFRFDADAGLLTLYEAPAYTSLGTAAQTFTPGADIVGKAEIRTATKKLYIAGVQKISSATDAITQVGKAGITGGVATATTGLHIDSFKVTNA
jgi:hypothetical protein